MKISKGINYWTKKKNGETRFSACRRCRLRCELKLSSLVSSAGSMDGWLVTYHLLRARERLPSCRWSIHSWLRRSLNITGLTEISIPIPRSQWCILRYQSNGGHRFLGVGRRRIGRGQRKARQKNRRRKEELTFQCVSTASLLARKWWGFISTSSAVCTTPLS